MDKTPRSQSRRPGSFPDATTESKHEGFPAMLQSKTRLSDRTTRKLQRRWLSGEESICQCRRCSFDPWVRKIPWEGNGNPFQYSCLGNPTDRGAWWVTVPEVAKEADMAQRLNTTTRTATNSSQAATKKILMRKQRSHTQQRRPCVRQPRPDAAK